MGRGNGVPTALERPGCVVSIRSDGWYGRVADDPCGPILPYERVPAHPPDNVQVDGGVLAGIKNHQDGLCRALEQWEMCEESINVYVYSIYVYTSSKRRPIESNMYNEVVFALNNK